MRNQASFRLAIVACGGRNGCRGSERRGWPHRRCASANGSPAGRSGWGGGGSLAASKLITYPSRTVFLHLKEKSPQLTIFFLKDTLRSSKNNVDSKFWLIPSLLFSAAHTTLLARPVPSRPGLQPDGAVAGHEALDTAVPVAGPPLPPRCEHGVTRGQQRSRGGDAFWGSAMGDGGGEGGGSPNKYHHL